MVNISCRSFARHTVAIFCGLFIALIIVTPVALLRSLVFKPSFSTSTLIPHDQPIPAPGTDNTYYLSWQEPFNYEAAVYASTQKTIPQQNQAQFFDNSQLLWRVDSQNLENRYPTLRSRRVSVNIPTSVRTDRSRSRALYVHIFAQQAGKLAEQPDLTDPYMVHSVSELVSWESQFSTNKLSLTTIQVVSTDSSHLVAAPSVSWAMSVENHGYTEDNVPIHISKELALPRSQALAQQKRYNPPMFVNGFTKNVPKQTKVSTAAASADKKLPPVYASAIEVDLELRGLKQGWISAKYELIKVFDPEYINSRSSGSRNRRPSSDNDKSNKVIRTILLALSAMLYNYLTKLGVPALLFIIACAVLILALAALGGMMLMLYWLSPRTRWIGYSRVTFGISFLAQLFATISSAATKGSVSSVINPFLFIQMYLLLLLTGTPINPMTWYQALRQGLSMPQSDESENGGAYEMVDTSEDDHTNSAKAQHIEHIISVRKEIDQLGLRWMRLLIGPLFIVVVVYCLIVSSESLGIFGHIMLTFATVLQWLMWLPQILINHKTRSGSHIPVGANACEIGIILLAAMIINISGFQLPSVLTSSEAPTQICNAVLVAQWIIFIFAKRIVLDWDLTYVQASPDNQSERRVIGVNGKWPPPTVHVSLGDTLIINAHNSLDEATSLHTHGFFQNGTNFYDGAVGATECGIAPNSTYSYEINVTQTGTYWIHSHYMAQYVDGLRTPLISHPPKEHYDYDKDIVVMLEAWYSRSSRDIRDQLLSTSERIRTAPFQPQMLINSVGGQNTNQTKLEIRPGKKYRLRLINVSGTAMVRFGIEDHKLQVIEVDGVDTEIKEVNSMQLSVGQRASVLVTAKNTTQFNYIYHADIFTDIQLGVARSEIPYMGIVEYSPDAELKNDTARSSVDWDFFEDIDLVPIEKTPPPGVHKWVPLEVHTSIFDDRREHLAFNNRTYKPPIVPSLVTALTTGFQAYYPDVYGFKSNPVILDPLTDVEVAIFNLDVNSHPFHLHGHNFFIMVRGTIDRNQKNRIAAAKFPIRRDTITVPPTAYAIVRFRADNPGVWLFHCHMQFHVEQGLAMTFVEAPFRIAANITLPQQLKQNCDYMGIPTQGNAMGRHGLDMHNEVRGPFPITGL
ncbi:ferroxidase fet3 [Kickxella alabastrina]|uniref:Ferroxidase fet3 n=1 Tax=Kickxella alabastrina TaxID=61397 RepID=A0ACC1IUE9_9FUNG|nr:ferroxidase fet3 [Kickxella alabastrina]